LQRAVRAADRDAAAAAAAAAATGTAFAACSSARRKRKSARDRAKESPSADGGAVADHISGIYFSGTVLDACVGTRYQFQLDDEPLLLPDPASRWQPDGPHGPSVVVDPTCFPWTDRDWRGCVLNGQVLYELHVGTFTRAGTLRAAADELEESRWSAGTLPVHLRFIESHYHETMQSAAARERA
jgi:maltooligosyltrehalose trehalohydrolase